MRISPLTPVLFLAILSAAAAGPGLPPLRFDGMALGNVARILSARFHTPVAIASEARAPISGDFSSLGIRDALTEAARQAGLVVVPLGPDPGAGYCLMRRPPEPAGPPTPAGNLPQETKAALQAAAQRRAELLRERAALALQASDADSAN